MIGIMLSVEETWHDVDMQLYYFEKILGITYHWKRVGNDEHVQARRAKWKADWINENAFIAPAQVRAAGRLYAVRQLWGKLFDVCNEQERKLWNDLIQAEKARRAAQ